MASKKKGASVQSITLEVLKRIHAELRGIRTEHGEKLEVLGGKVEATNHRLAAVEVAVQTVADGLAGLHQDVLQLETSTIEGFTAVRVELDRNGARIDNLAGTIG